MRDEFEKIEWLKSRFQLDGDAKELVIGIGDDAAVMDFGNRPTVITVDTQVENVHFRLDLLSHQELGYRSMVAAVSDIWAMAALPNASVVALNLPGELADEDFQELIEGLACAARATGARVIGGNLSRGDALAITTTVFGLPVADPVGRDGAKVGDAIYVTGALGSAAAGLAVLEAGRLDLEHGPTFAERWRKPPINGQAAKLLAKLATAAVDVSDGCLQDLGHVCTASHVAATLFAHDIPKAPGYEATCVALGFNPLDLALAGGEDYELLFTAPASAGAASVATRIGEITEGTGIRVVDAQGRPIQVSRVGFRHFS
ncbi:MAG: thiamine-phosphate kinase [Myxococcales bacterium]|jgi:thiamine-monophosphate kinase